MGAIVETTGLFGNYFVGNNFLSRAQMEQNAVYIRDFLHDRGWALEAIAGLLGNSEYEGNLNPGVWEMYDDNFPCFTWYSFNPASPSGAGLVGWTPSCTRLLPWAANLGVSWQDMDFQLNELDFEFTHNRDGAGYPTGGPVWFGSATMGMSVNDFKTNALELSAYDMAVAFQGGYERPAFLQPEVRGNAAEVWYEFLGGIPPGTKPRKKKSKLLFMGRPRIYGL